MKEMQKEGGSDSSDYGHSLSEEKECNSGKMIWTVENKRTDQTKGADMDRAMELQMNSHNYTIMLSPT